MNFFYILKLLLSGDSLIESLQSIIKTAGIIAIAFILLFGFMFALPSIISGLKKSRLRWLICILNVISIVLLFYNVILPLIIWLVLMILAIAGKKDTEKIENIGINITYK